MVLNKTLISISKKQIEYKVLFEKPEHISLGGLDKPDVMHAIVLNGSQIMFSKELVFSKKHKSSFVVNHVLKYNITKKSIP